jgi:hypothetical protein
MDAYLSRRIAFIAIAFTPPRDDVFPLYSADCAPAGHHIRVDLLSDGRHGGKAGKLLAGVHVVDTGGKHGLCPSTQTRIATNGSDGASAGSSKGLAIADLPSAGKVLGSFAFGLLSVFAALALFMG